jgi:peroxin-1
VDIAQPCVFINSAHLTSVIVEEVATESSRSVTGNPLPLKTIREAGFLKEVTTDVPAIDENVFAKERLNLTDLLSTYLRSNGISLKSESELSFCSILVSGPKGCGKNSLIASVLSKHQNIHISTIDCKNLHGKRLDSVCKYLMKEISEAIYQEPAVVIFRDLDFFIPSQIRPEEENSVETVHILRCVLILITIMKRLQAVVAESGMQVAVIATARSEDRLFPVLFDKVAFNHYISISAPNQQERALLIKCFARRFAYLNSCLQMSDELVSTLSKKSEGFYPSDLGLFMEQCTHLQMSSTDHHHVEDEDIVKLIASFQPISQRGIGLTCKSTKRLRDVGGLESVKKMMQDTLFLPLKYPVLFRKCPLRPHSCLLLYGVPGTGKTLLAEAFANECGVNFLSVEGPELLSKYIGASEQAVRDLFQRAKAVKPCIIFFDEFDSIAPRRGQDSTGVTDRVVNQLLTQMDGVEELDRGIFIVAATSRPDLLDPALLRPGRFDKRLKCTLPDRQERRQILDIICRNLSLHPDVDLNMIADRTEFYSAADLQAIFFTAQVAAAHKHLDESVDLQSEILDADDSIFDSSELDGNEERCENGFDDVAKAGSATKAHSHESLTEITMSQILEAMSSVRCSVTEKERRKYDFM